MSNPTQIDLKFEPPRATVTFRTQDGLNVMSASCFNRLESVVAELGRRPDIRFCLFKAEGKVWIAGADIAELSAMDKAQARKLSVRGNEVLDALEMLPCVTVAVLQGAALGGGYETALACDFRIAVGSAKIGLPETALGLIPGWGGIKRIARLTSSTIARRLVFSAGMISAAEGKALGLVDEVVEKPEQLDGAVETLLATLRRGGPHAVGRAKRALLTGDEVDAFADCFTAGESREGMAAFFEKRAATWMEK